MKWMPEEVGCTQKEACFLFDVLRRGNMMAVWLPDQVKEENESKEKEQMEETVVEKQHHHQQALSHASEPHLQVKEIDRKEDGEQEDGDRRWRMQEEEAAKAERWALGTQARLRAATSGGGPSRAVEHTTGGHSPKRAEDSVAEAPLSKGDWAEATREELIRAMRVPFYGPLHDCIGVVWLTDAEYVPIALPRDRSSSQIGRHTQPSKM